MKHLDESLILEDLARQTATSVRTLTRKFRQETGMTPMQWLASSDCSVPVDCWNARASQWTV